LVGWLVEQDTTIVFSELNVTSEFGNNKSICNLVDKEGGINIDGSIKWDTHEKLGALDSKSHVAK